MTNVQGYCPMGCGDTLILGAAGYVTCAHLECPRSDAVTDLLCDREVHHVVTFTDTGFLIRHPLLERLDNQLETCEMNDELQARSGPPVTPGRYRALPVWNGSERIAWAWDPVEAVHADD